MTAPSRSVTDNGLTIYDEFEDSFGSLIRIQASSAADYAAVWIFAISPKRYEDPSPHLTVEQAERTRDALDTFIRENKTP